MCSERLFAGWLALAGALAAQAPTAPELVALAFPGAAITTAERALTAAQQQAASERAQTKVPASVPCHTATRDGKVVGYAYVDTRTVRTHGQSLLVCLDADGKVVRVEVLAFAEPRQYQPRAAFYAQFLGRGLDDTLRLRRGVASVAGATLSAVAAVDAVRTVLAVHAVLEPAK